MEDETSTEGKYHSASSESTDQSSVNNDQIEKH